MKMRRTKIDRKIGSSPDIVRIDVYRIDDMGAKFKTSASIDPATFELAAALHGGSAPARQWLMDRATELWEEDRLNRRFAEAKGVEFHGTISISRELQREVVESATSKMLAGHTVHATVSAMPPKRGKPRRTSGKGDRMAGSLVEIIITEDGQVSGTVLAGDLERRDLGSLRLESLLSLLTEARDLDDQTDTALLEAFLDREHPDWRNALDEGSDTLKKDRDILGVSADADAEQIKMAHRRLTKKVHPDIGGTDALASIVNLAKDRLLAAIAVAEEAKAEKQEAAA